jgi:cytochrome P450
MFAGSGTTSTTLVYLLYAISAPGSAGVQDRLRHELSLMPEDLQALQNAPYLNAVIKETFRLYPTIISTLPRILDNPMEVEGLIIPAGTRIGMQNFVHHRDPTAFPCPNDFQPERWLTSTKAMEAALTPFSVGRRSCIGQNLAWSELYIGVSHLLRRVRISLSPDMRMDDMEMEDRFNIAPRGRKLLLHLQALQ